MNAGLPIVIRKMSRRDLATVCALVARAFDRGVALDYSAEGAAAFAEYAHPDAIGARLGQGHEVLVAEVHDRVAGVVEVRQGNHISMLFVEPDLWRVGIGKWLLHAALEFCDSQEPRPGVVTVNSSPGAATFYERCGFSQAGQVRDVRGILGIPMSIARG